MERWERINAAPAGEARAQLRICCGSSRWVERMMAHVPFASRDAARAAARDEWFALSAIDWREAFAHHPKIGEQRPASPPVAPDFRPASPASPASPAFSASAALSAREQAGVGQAANDIKHALAEGNRMYEARFGYIFIVCAAGKSAEEILAILRERMTNDPGTELRVAAEEHAKICDLRLTAAV